MPSTRIDEHRTEKLLKEYTELAPTYDQRWSAYLDASLCMTLETVADLPAERVLDVGCGTGQLLELLAKRSDVPELVGIDRVPAMLDVARQRLGMRASFVEGEVAPEEILVSVAVEVEPALVAGVDLVRHVVPGAEPRLLLLRRRGGELGLRHAARDRVADLPGRQPRDLCSDIVVGCRRAARDQEARKQDDRRKKSLPRHGDTSG